MKALSGLPSVSSRDRQVNHRIHLLHLIATVSASFINIRPEKIDAAINRALKLLGKFERVDRCYIFEFGETRRTVTNTYEWCAEGIAPQRERLQALPLAEFSWFGERITRNEVVHLASLGELPPEAANERIEFERQSIRSLLCVPMTLHGVAIGFLGFDSVRRERRWSDESITLLRIVGEMFISVIQRRETECQLMESRESLRSQKEFLRQVIDSDPNLIFAKDRSGRFTLVNKAVADLYGSTVEDLLGRTDADFNECAEEVEWFRRDDLEVLDTGAEKFIPEECVTDAEGRTRWLQTVKRRLTGVNGIPEQVLGIATDITARKRAEQENMSLQQQLIHSQKMEAIGELAAGIAHDLNNALSAVSGHLHLVQLGVRSADRRGLEDSIGQALKGCNRAAALIERLLGFSRRGKYDVQQLEVHWAVRDTVDFLSRVMERGVRLETRPFAGGRLYVNADANQLQQVFTNLILNAQQAIEGAGTITIEFDRRTVTNPAPYNRSAAPGRYVAVTVRDTGCGIPPENMRKLFDPFFTTKRDAKGTGLGLSMVYGIMQNHGGWVTAESELGKGAAFSLLFPEAVLAADAIRPLVAIRAADRHATVMVIDDEPELCEVMKQLLETSGHTAFVFTSGEAALEWYRENFRAVDLVLLDMKMPGMDGPACFRRLREANAGAKIALWSGYVNDESAREMLARGAEAFFRKPIKYAEFLEWLTAAVRPPLAVNG